MVIVGVTLPFTPLCSQHHYVVNSPHHTQYDGCLGDDVWGSGAFLTEVFHMGGHQPCCDIA